VRYLGGKSKIAKRIAAVILATTNKRKRLIEPFVGGGGTLAVLAPHFQQFIAVDEHRDLILMFKALQDGWEPPSDISETRYKELREAPASAERGFVGFGPSWGGKWFGGYARGDGRNYADETRRSLLRDRDAWKHGCFLWADYAAVSAGADDVIYCDPPYDGTTGYSGTPWNRQQFFDTATKWAKSGASVFLSEYDAPEPWECLWEVQRTRDMRGDMKTAEQVTEKLYTLNLSE